jgi:hypothetical protein
MPHPVFIGRGAISSTGQSTFCWCVARQLPGPASSISTVRLYRVCSDSFFLCIIMGRMENNTKISNDLLAFFITDASLLYCSAGRLRLRNHHFRPPSTYQRRPVRRGSTFMVDSYLLGRRSLRISLSLPQTCRAAIAIATTHSTTAGNQRNSYSPSTHTSIQPIDPRPHVYSGLISNPHCRMSNSSRDFPFELFLYGGTAAQLSDRNLRRLLRHGWCNNNNKIKIKI